MTPTTFNRFSTILLLSACLCGKSQITPTWCNEISLQLSTYESTGATKAGVMPAIREGSKLAPVKARFDYLLLNIPRINDPASFQARDSINSLYPDTVTIRRLYLERYCNDRHLHGYFQESYLATQQPSALKQRHYSREELMEVASKFFYCDLVNPDTTVQAHVCIGLNGIKEANWKNDYTLLAAFCYEGIFHQFEADESPLWDAFVNEKRAAAAKFKPGIRNLDQYLEDVRLDLFRRMKQNSVLKRDLLSYYGQNKHNLAFIID